MADYIERTEELMLAMNAGARAIENTKRYHGASYCKDVFSRNPKGIPYLRAAEVLREASEASAADAVPVVRCRDCQFCCTGIMGPWCSLADGMLVISPDAFCSYGERREEIGT